MKSEPDNRAAKAVTSGLAKGCLLGVGMAVLFAAIGGLLYLGAGLTGMPERIVMLIAIAGGPILGTVVVFFILLRRARKASQVNDEGSHETTDRY